MNNKQGKQVAINSAQCCFPWLYSRHLGEGFSFQAQDLHDLSRDAKAYDLVAFSKTSKKNFQKTMTFDIESSES